MLQKKFSIVLIILISCYSITCSQTPVTTHYITDNIFNWGIRAGLNAVVPSYYSITYEGVATANQSMINEVGYSGGLLARVNMSLFFIQPEVSYYYTPEKMHFTMQEDVDMTIQTKNQSLSVAVLPGFNIVKEGPFLFNILIGPAVYYNFLTAYEVNRHDTFKNKEDQYRVSMITGMSANISRLYFDFRVSISMKSSTLDFSAVETAPSYLKGVTVRDNGNTLNFSCGIMF